MAARNSKSRKASGANSGSAQQHELVFFLDKCLGRIIVADALRACGEHVELMEDHFDSDTEDIKWVPKVGERGWIILSKDSALRRNNIELVALLKSGTHSFILTSASQTGAEMAKAFATALPDIKQLIGKFRPPFVATVTPVGNVHVYYTHDKLIQQITSNQNQADNLAEFKKTADGSL